MVVKLLQRVFAVFQLSQHSDALSLFFFFLQLIVVFLLALDSYLPKPPFCFPSQAERKYSSVDVLAEQMA